MLMDINIKEIPYEEYIQLKKDSMQFLTLLQCRVDTWQGFADSQKISNNLIKDFLDDEHTKKLKKLETELEQVRDSQIKNTTDNLKKLILSWGDGLSSPTIPFDQEGIQQELSSFWDKSVKCLLPYFKNQQQIKSLCKYETS